MIKQKLEHDIADYMPKKTYIINYLFEGSEKIKNN